jgi:hypothetical protein
MKSLAKRKLQKKYKKILRGRVSRLCEMAHKLDLMVACDKYGGFLFSFDLLGVSDDYRLVTRDMPTVNLIQGNLYQVEVYVERLWNLKAFL